jgi:hypothetical protein
MEGEKNKFNGSVDELNVNNRDTSSFVDDPSKERGCRPHSPEIHDRDGMAHGARRGMNGGRGEIDTPKDRMQQNYSLRELQRLESERGGAQHELSRRARAPGAGRYRGGVLECSPLFYNYYEQVQLRKQKITSFLQKDLYQINRPDLRGFLNTNHAIECLLPYHIFSPMIYEDALFANTGGSAVIEDDLRMTLGLLEESIRLEKRPLVTEKSLVVDLLLYYEQRYINTLCRPEREETHLQEKSRQKKSKGLLNKRNTVLRLRYVPESYEGDGASMRDGKLYLKKAIDVA